MKLVLGSAQFSSAYGINNKYGRVNFSEIKKIISLADKNAVRYIDTSIEYKNCESLLGKIGIQNFNIISKIPFYPHEKKYDYYYKKIIEKSLQNLKINQIYCYLIHSPQKFSDNQLKKLFEILEIYKKNKIIKKIGISIYSPKELNRYFNIFKPDIIQGPYNIFDNRIVSSGWLAKLNKFNIEFHARSIFLQGLIFMNYNIRNKKFYKWRKFFDSFDSLVKKNKTKHYEAAFNYIYNNPMIDAIIFGVENSNQFLEIINSKKKSNSYKKYNFKINDEILLNPYNWDDL